MIHRVLAGVETEYGFLVDGRGAEHQVEDATLCVRAYPGPCFVGWDYRQESPRADLRGFNLDALAVDPEDAKFDARHVRSSDRELRADRVLPNGARFYNDHGHPEYATPECWGLRELALQDMAGEIVVRRSGSALSQKLKKRVRLYKNNSDFHGASFGCHESYLVPRALGFERLYQAVTPMLLARQILTGSGKVGSESGAPCRFQISQRADFFVEPANAETLYRRPVFNTRDEPHADPREWTRLHVISGDANMMAGCTARKVGLVKLSVLLETLDATPRWRVQDIVQTFQSVSRDDEMRFVVPLEGGNHTTAYDIVESYLAASERFVLPECMDADRGEYQALISECRALLESIRTDGSAHRSKVDWAAKKALVETYREEESLTWESPVLQAVDMEYHNLDPDEGLFHVLESMGSVEAQPDVLEVLPRIDAPSEPNRAAVRGLAVSKFGKVIVTMSWSSITFTVDGAATEVYLPPDRLVPAELADAPDVVSFIRMLEATA